MKTPAITKMHAFTGLPVESLKPRLTKPAGILRGFGLIALALLLATGSSTWAQTVRFKTPRVRVTVPLNSTGTTIITNFVTVGALGGNPVNFDVSGLPAGASYTLTDQDTNALTSTLTSTNLWLWLTTANVAQGVYNYNLNASGGAANSITLVLQVGYVWNGTTNASADGPGSWANSANWLGGGAPGPADDVIFGIFGLQTNTTSSLPSATNQYQGSVVDSDITIASLRFAQTNTPQFHTVRINPGRTLSVTGNKGFSLLRDYIADATYGNINPAMSVTIFGTNGSLIVSNQNANFAVLNDGQGNNVVSTFDMSRLDNFTADVSRFGVGDYLLYPNYASYSFTNQYNGIPRRFLPTVNFARTNIIRATYADPYNHTNYADRSYSFSFLNTETAGTTTQPNILLGVSNAFFCDSVNLVGANQQGNVRFNPFFSTNNACVAYFRNTNGGRMSVFSISDAAGTNTANSNIKSTIDFGGGTLDLLADRFYIARDRKLIGNGQPNYQGTFSMGKGLVDVNTAVVGYQETFGQTNIGAFRGYCQGRITVTNTGVFKVNNTLTLGYSAQTDPNGFDIGFSYGQVFLLGGGTLIANNIRVGEPLQTSVGNYISNFNNATLIISNTVASPDKKLDLLYMSDSSLTLHVNLTNTGGYVHTTNFSTAGINTLNLGALPRFPNYPTQITLVSFNTGGGSLTLGTFPFNTNTQPATPNLFNNPNSVDLYLDVLSPQQLVWKGYINGDWDLTTQNWATTNGIQTNFHNGDFAILDNTAISTTTLNVTADILPGQSTVTPGILVTNTRFNYTLNSGGGSIRGGNLLKKATRNLVINVPMTSAVQITNTGIVSGSGSMGSTVVDAGATLNFSGGITGAVSIAGSAVCDGYIKGPISIQTGGAFTNNGTVEGTLAFQGGGQAVNNAGFTWNMGSSTLASNSTLINFGIINADTLTVNGTLREMGLGYMILTTMTLGSGANFFPGGTGIGTSTVYSSGVGTFPGRVSFSAGSTNFFKVSLDVPSPGNTLFLSGRQGLGPNQSVPSSSGCTIVISNIGVTPFTPGLSFKLLGNSFNGGNILNSGLNTDNSYPVVRPAAPGPGMAWDLRNLWTPDGNGQNGIIRIIPVATNPFTLGYLPTYATTYVYATNVSGGVTNITTTTNHTIISQLTWPAGHIGWRLEQQSSPLDVGLSTNWTEVFGSSSTNIWLFTNTLMTVTQNNTNRNTGTFFLRTVYP